MRKYKNIANNGVFTTLKALVPKTFGFIRFAESLDDFRYGLSIKVNYRLRH